MANRFTDRFTQSSNPVFSEKSLAKESAGYVGQETKTFTLQSAINKTFVLMGLLLFTSVIGFQFPNPVFIIGGAIGGLIVVLISVFKKQWSPVLAPIYAILEGLCIGGISNIYAAAYNGIILQAISLTLLVFFIMLVLYKTRIIPVTNKLRVGIVMATGAIFLIYLLSWILGFFGINMPMIHESGPIGIIFSLVVIGIAALNLLLDFDLFEKGEQMNAPSYMEWFAGLGLMITVVWIYIEMLRLLSRLRE